MFCICFFFVGLVCVLVVIVIVVMVVIVFVLCVQFKMLMGNFIVEVYLDKVFKMVVNFLQYVKDGFYKGMIFYCVMDGFMIQGGGFMVDMKQKDICLLVEIELKNGLKNDKYMIVMVCIMDLNFVIVQFYVNVVDNNMFNYFGQDGYGYIVFGKVVDGIDIIDKIKVVEIIIKFLYQNVFVKLIVIELVIVVFK